MKRKSVLAMILCICIFVSVFAVPVHAVGYSDVSKTHWAYQAINKWSDYGILSGYNGKFNPSGNLTRGEMAVILDKLLLLEGRAPNLFYDLDNNWYTDAILRCVGAGILSGSNGYIHPKDNISRQEAFCMLYRALEVQMIEEPTRSQFSFYKDINDISDWAFQSVATMLRYGYISGSNRQIRPRDNISRAETVALLDQIISVVVNDGDRLTGSFDANVVVRSSKTATLTDCHISGNLVYSVVTDYSSCSLKNITCRLHIFKRRCEDCAFSVYEKPMDEGSEAGSFAKPGDAGDSVTENGKIVYGDKRLEILPGVPKNILSNSGFSTDSQGRISYSSNGFTAEQGVDVSSWQKDIDWAQVAADGISFAIIRVGYRGYETGEIAQDAYFEKNIKGALSAGLKVGVYFFSQALTEKEAQEEAKYVLSRVKGYDVRLPLVFDWENVSDTTARTNHMSKDALNKCAVAFCETVRAAGYEPCVYFGANKGYMTLDLSMLKDYTFWFARYKSDLPRFYYSFNLWQYSSTGKVKGINGYVDRDLCFVKY